MLIGNFRDRLLQGLNMLLGVGAIILIARGFSVNDGLTGLGVALLMTSGIGWVAFRFSVEQEAREKKTSSASNRSERKHWDLAS